MRLLRGVYFEPVGASSTEYESEVSMGEGLFDNRQNVNTYMEYEVSYWEQVETGMCDWISGQACVP